MGSASEVAALTPRSAIVAIDVASVADTVTKTVIAVLTLIAVALVVVGLVRAWRGRRRAQVVIQDLEPMDGHSSSVTAGLSPQLRQAVRKALSSQSEHAVYAHATTVQDDMATGLLVTSRTTTITAVTTELQASAQDSLVALSAGVRALAPAQAEGLLAVLGASLPAQRGWVVRTFPAVRVGASGTEVGVTVEFSELGHAPDAVTAFWNPLPSGSPAGDDAELSAPARRALYDLLEPASQWIAIRLVARHVDQAGPGAHRRLDVRRHRRRELAGVRKQLAGQMSLYATRRTSCEASFAEQALEDLADAARLLPGYFRPDYMQGNVHELVGWAHRRNGREGPARQEFIAAVRAYDRADALLVALDASTPTAVGTAARAAIAIRRTKCRLLSDDRAQLTVAHDELNRWVDPASPTWRVLYNAACLFAVALLPGDGQPEGGDDYEWRAWHLLGRALLRGGAEAPWDHALEDEELDGLDHRRRAIFFDELKARNGALTALTEAEADPLVAEAMGAIGVAQRTG